MVRGGKIQSKYIHYAVRKKKWVPFKPILLLTPFSSHSPPSTCHAPDPSLDDDKGNRLPTEHEYSCGSGEEGLALDNLYIDCGCEICEIE